MSDSALLLLEEARLQRPAQQLHHRDGSDQRLRPLVTTLATIPPDDDDQSSTDGELEEMGIRTVDDAQAALADIAAFEEQDELSASDEFSAMSDPDSTDMDSDASAVDREADELSAAEKQADEAAEKQADQGGVVSQPVSLLQQLEEGIKADNLTYVPVPEMPSLPVVRTQF